MTARSRTAAALLASVALVGLAAIPAAIPAQADPSPPPEKDKQLASDLTKKAIAKSLAGDHNSAIDLYLKAYTIVPNSALLSNIGAEYRQSARPQQALRYFCMYLDKDPSGANAPYAAAQARSLQIELGNQDVDDRDVCAKPRPRPRPRPEPKEPPAEPESGVGPGGRPVREPEPLPRDDRASRDNALKYVGIGAGIGGAVAVGVGIYAGIRASEISNEISTHDRTMKWPDDIQDLQHRGQSYENVQIGALIVGGLAVTTGVVLYVISGSDSPSERPGDKAALTVSPTTNGFVVFGRF